MNISITIIEKLKELRILVESPSTAEADKIVARLTNREADDLTILKVKTYDGFEFIQIGDIYFIEVIKDELHIHLEKQTIITKDRLYKLLDQLEGKSFVQVHKCYVIHIPRIKNSFSGNMSALLTNNQTVNVSRRHLPTLKTKLGI